MTWQWQQPRRQSPDYLDSAWALQNGAWGFSSDVVGADQPATTADGQLMAAPAAEQINGVLTELTSFLSPLQQLLSRGMSGIIAACCDRKQLPWQELGEGV